MSSSSAASPDRLPGVEIGDYDPRDSAAAVELERACAQAQAAGLRLAFRRSTFHARAELFAEHRLFAARRDGRLVGVCAVAVKPARLFGEPLRTAFGFDLRVHPELRGRGLGDRLYGAVLEWALARADLVYTFVAGGNAAAGRLAGRHLAEVGGYRYLVYPAYQHRPVAGALEPVAPDELQSELARCAGPFDLESEPSLVGPPPGTVGSWLLRQGRELAGCSAWDGRGVLAEVLEALPAHLRGLRGLLRLVPARLRPWPRIPEDGEELRSWYLFDAFATAPAAGRDLLRAVAATARERGIDYCYLIHAGSEPWVAAARRDLPRPFAPIVAYRLFMIRPGQPARPIERLRVDVRDV